jgi:hypothetical protein
VSGVTSTSGAGLITNTPEKGLIKSAMLKAIEEAAALGGHR